MIQIRRVIDSNQQDDRNGNCNGIYYCHYPKETVRSLVEYIQREKTATTEQQQKVEVIVEHHHRDNSSSSSSSSSDSSCSGDGR